MTVSHTTGDRRAAGSADAADRLLPLDPEAAKRVCAALLGEPVLGVEDPGSSGRKSLRVVLHKGRTAIVTRRDTSGRAALEVAVLRALAAEGAPVPRVLAFDGLWVVQEDLGRERLSRRLAQADPDAGERLLAAALDSLIRVHAAGEAAGLAAKLYRIGSKPGWLDGLLTTPARLGAFLAVPAPALPEKLLGALFEAPGGSFVKWDARPPNAAICAHDAVAWFDWEHCGRRNRVDDMIWLLGDESVPEWPRTEGRLVAAYLPRFDEGGYAAGAETYFHAFGTFHVAVRLANTVAAAARRKHRNWRTALAGGRIGRLPPAAGILCRRGARWADRTAATRPLAGWFAAIRDRFR